MTRAGRIPFGTGALLVLTLATSSASAQVIGAEPVVPILAPPPEGTPPIEVQIVVQAVVDAVGNVESAVVTSRAPADAPASFAASAVAAVRAAKFHPSTRDGRPMRSRVEYVMVFHAAQGDEGVPSAPPPLVSPPETPSPIVDIRGVGWPSPRGVGDIRVTREVLDASPRQQTSEMLSAAPGFFVDHEDGEGLGNDVYLRGWDLDHGSGIEMRVGSVPINIPTHIQGQGYADANFIIPEVVRSIRVLEGPYDPRQGDAAIVGSALFDLGVPDRGYHVKVSAGSFDQVRVVGIVAPKETDEDTFVAFSLRKTDGFGTNRASQSGSINAQFGVDLGASDHLRFLATAYGARAALPGVVRQDDVDAKRIDEYGSYASFGGNQSVQSSRVILAADLDHVTPSGARFDFEPWVMWTDFRARQNFTGDFQSSEINPALSGIGDLFETTNTETAAGVTARFHSAPTHIAKGMEIVFEPGVTMRGGHTGQSKSLLDPVTLNAWDRRLDAGIQTLDAGAYLDLDLRIAKRFRLSGGPRADLLMESITDRLANVVPAGSAPPGALPGALRDVAGVAVGPRITAEVEATRSLSIAASYGEGFRSLDAAHLSEGTSAPYSKVRSVEIGLRAEDSKKRFTSTLAIFDTWVANELVFEATSGGLETENASTRRGVVGSLLAKPFDWLLSSTALSVTNAVFTTLVPGISHYVPNVPPILFREDVTMRGRLATVRGRGVTGRIGVGYTFLSGRHMSDALLSPATHALNAGAAIRYEHVELGIDAYNVLGLRYADDAEVYVSNWSLRPGQQPASVATHITAAPPRTVLGTASLHF